MYKHRHTCIYKSLTSLFFLSLLSSFKCQCSLSYLTSTWLSLLWIVKHRAGSSLANIALTQTVGTQPLALEMDFCTVLPIWLIQWSNTTLVHPTRDALRMQVNMFSVYPFAVQWRAFSIVCFTWSLETITEYTLQLIGMFLVVDIFQV